MKTDKQQAVAAAAFAERWKGRGYERGESQPFWIDLLSNVYGIETPSDGFISFEDHRMDDEQTMSVELRRAHQDNDRAVMAAYGFSVKTMTESLCVAELFKLYQQLTK